MADLDRAITAAREAMETKVHSLSDGEYILASRSRALRDLLAALDAAVPDGYALVPVEPTTAMRRAFLAEEDAPTFLTHTTIAVGDFGSRYRAMLAAAERKGGE